jgi:hypothetical protein
MWVNGLASAAMSAPRFDGNFDHHCVPSLAWLLRDEIRDIKRYVRNTRAVAGDLPIAREVFETVFRGLSMEVICCDLPVKRIPVALPLWLNPATLRMPHPLSPDSLLDEVALCCPLAMFCEVELDHSGRSTAGTYILR